MMEKMICTACGTQFSSAEHPPEICPICIDERQFVPQGVQRWTTLAALARGHMTAIRDEFGVIGLGVAPQFAIGQRALLLQTPEGNVLWDCISLIEPASIAMIKALGGLSCIAISHPHFYGSMQEWSAAFGNVPIYLHEADRKWVFNPGPAIRFWSGDTKQISSELTLIRCPGHFDGGQVLHWAGGMNSKGAIMAGDILQVAADRKHLGFMRSYPNFIPLGGAAVREIAARVGEWSFEAIYGGFWQGVIPKDAKRAFETSIARHLDWVRSDPVSGAA